jgi:P27 family predicted phage terminase small subunit
MKGARPPNKPFGNTVDDDVIDLPPSTDRIPEAPKKLEGLARELWPRVVGDLVVRNTYDEDCQDVAAAYCIQLARFLTAEDDIKIRGIEMKWGKYGTKINPSLKISNEACKLMMKLASELGLSPASRKRVVKVRGGTKAAALKFLKQA